MPEEDNKQPEPGQPEIIDLPTRERPRPESPRPVINILIAPFKPLHRRYKRRWQESKHHFILDSCLLLIVVGLIILNVNYFLQYKTIIAGDRDIDLTLTMATPVKSSQEVSFDIVYANKKTVPLKDTQLTLDYPEGFVFKTALPAPRSGTVDTWDLAEVPVGESGVIKITGQFVGEAGSQDRLSAYLRFSPGGSVQRAQQVTIKKYTISDTYFSLNFSLPEAVTAREVADYGVSYTFAGTNTTLPARLYVELPEGFVLTGSTDGFSSERYWDLGTLAGAVTGEYSLSGYFTSAQPSDRAWVGHISLGKNDHWYAQASTDGSLRIAPPQLEASLVRDEAIANWADEIHYRLELHNTGDTDLHDLSVEVTSDFNVLNLGGSQLAGGRLEADKLVWTSERNSLLSELSAQQTKVLRFTLRLRDNPTVGTHQTVTTSSRVLHASAGEPDGGTLLAESGGRITTVSTAPLARSLGRMFGPNGEQFGFGPVPPKVGFPTTYRIFWSVGTTTNSLKNVKLSATLPTGVVWVGAPSVSRGGDVYYDGDHRMVTWSVGDLPERTSETSGGYQASFLVQLKPTSQQVGSVPHIIDEVQMFGVDSFTGGAVTTSTDAVTTNLDGDPQVAGQGTVVR